MKSHKYQIFIDTVQSFYKKQGRHDLPWRMTTDPYCIAVSEIMLQQTQVRRVIEKYISFIAHFPTVYALASAPLSEVLRLWNGLGYNRRAKFLHAMAQTVVSEYGGVFPHTVDALRSLPGIGPYTASAIAAFAYDTPSVCIETNIRTVFLHHFFDGAACSAVSDTSITPYIAETLPKKHVRQWYWALMDYGSFLKQQGNTIHRKSAKYKKQSTFKGSPRQLRGAIIRMLTTEKKSLTKKDIMILAEQYAIEGGVVGGIVEGLCKEGLVCKQKHRYTLIS